MSAKAPAFEIRHAGAGDREAVSELLVREWGSTLIVGHGVSVDAAQLPAFVAIGAGGELAGVVTLSYSKAGCEVVTLNAVVSGAGVGSALLERARSEALTQGCRRLWLITTNDNLDAIGFYQRRGLRLVAVHRDAVDRARQLKPSIPLVGHHGIALHDELEFELLLEPGE